ncbi:MULTISPECIES: hypothetical protein [Megasphaera]|uniref:hypothetical protein n=1 Tax=Megasphaera TaxID=906 RepID=UPI0006C7F822|nr:MULTISPECIES: hypothetical protein [Megasphaera]ALG42983.1 hypothetical protein AZ49_10825 [Megasphaera elsdenii 14-14]
MSDSAQQAKAQKKAYDEACKRVLSEREIMAHILKSCTEEFKDCSLLDIAWRYIQGEPSISRIAVEPETISPRIESEQTEDKSGAEGTVYYDIRFHAVAPVDGKMIQLIINLEAQNDFNPGYPLLKRAVYYCGRMISSQYGTVFVKLHYEKIQKVYSIWICTMPTKKWEYNISRYRFTEEHLIGRTQAERSHYDLITIVLVCLGSKSHKQLKGILRLLNMLLLDNMGSQEKQELLAKEFNVTMTPHLEKGVATMCNLSEGIERRGERRGEKRGEKRGRKLGEEVGEKRGWNLGKQDDVLEMLKDGVPFEKIAQYTKLSLEAIADIAKQNKLI